jgi:serine/threonine protein phosphatase 1
MKTLNPRVLRLPRNQRGRDFVVGDVHGAFDAVHEAMKAAGFDPTPDRLFSVGDLVDRGLQSAYCVEFLAQPFVYAVRGNHEDLLLEAHGIEGSSATSAVWIDGAEWWRRESPAARRRIVATLKKLPLAIEVETERGSVGFVHADVPRSMDWGTFCAALERGDTKVQETALWGRHRIQSGDTSGVPGIGRLFVGHTVQTGEMRRFGNVYAVDTGAIFGELWGRSHGHVTLVETKASTVDLDMPRQVSRFDVRLADTEATFRPFGDYAASNVTPRNPPHPRRKP